MKIVVSHPGRQHSHQLAMGLADANLLLKYICGVPTHKKAGGVIASQFLSKYASAFSIPIDPQLVEHNFISPIARRISGRLMTPSAASSWSHRGDGWFDFLSARRISQLSPQMVIGYENSSLETFRAAKSIHAVTILDAASFHHQWQDKVHDYRESGSAHLRITQHKDREIELSDYILTVSDLAAQSYIEAGVDESKIFSLPMGVDTCRFLPKSMEQINSSLVRPVRFVFVGHVDYRKGADVLLKAIDRLAKANLAYELTVVGRYTSSLRFDGLPNVKYLGWMPQSELPKCLIQQDILVLPSRHDSFGMVVAEAMACGLSVIVSENVGAGVMVTPFKNGLIVKASCDSELATAMSWFIQNRDHLQPMSQFAVETAKSYTWDAYRQKAVTLLTSLLEKSC